jgi:hypothetical protein
MKNRLKCVDLFSGLGGFSESMYQRGWDVVRYDFDDSFSHIPETVIADVLSLTPEDLPTDPDLILASPPGTHFSTAAGWRYWKGGFPSPEIKPSVELVKYTLKLIHEIDPDYWVLENPRGMLRRIIGLPVVTTFWASWGMPYLKPTDLWGKIPAIDWPKPRNWITGTHGKHRGTQANKTDLLGYYSKIMEGKKGLLELVSAPALRSLVPFKFSEALAISVEEGRGGQTSL